MILLIFMIIGLNVLLFVIKDDKNHWLNKLLFENNFLNGILWSANVFFSLALILDFRYFISFCFFRKTLVPIDIKNYSSCKSKESKLKNLKIHMR
mgnify:CR=1 FL=1